MKNAGVLVGLGVGATALLLLTRTARAALPPPPPPPDYLAMPQDELFAYLADGSVGKDWWQLTSYERRTLGHRIIEGWGFFHATWWDIGYPSHDPDMNPSASQVQAQCFENSCIRWYIMASATGVHQDHYYWLDDKWEPCNPGYSFGLPSAFASIVNRTQVWYHSVIALQVEPDIDSPDSWLFYNFLDYAGPGSWQMPIDSEVTLWRADLGLSYDMATKRYGVPNGYKVPCGSDLTGPGYLYPVLCFTA